MSLRSVENHEAEDRCSRFCRPLLCGGMRLGNPWCRRVNGGAFCESVWRRWGDGDRKRSRVGEGQGLSSLRTHGAHGAPVRDGFLLFTSAPQRGQIALHRSRDGVSWTSEGVLDLGGLPEECGRTALDVSVQETESGYRVIVETWLRSSGLMDPSGREAPQEESPTVLCALESTDAERWVPVEQALRWPGLSKSWPSGLEFVGDSSSGLFYFVDTFPDLDGIRMGQLEGGVLTAVGRRATLLPEAHVDPMPVALENGGIRLYHSRSLEGILAVSDSTDGQNFGESRPLKGLSGQVCHAPPERPSPPDACFLDPALIQAVDGRLVMYFSVFESLPGGVERRGIGRAFAVD